MKIKTELLKEHIYDYINIGLKIFIKTTLIRKGIVRYKFAVLVMSAKMYPAH